MRRPFYFIFGFILLVLFIASIMLPRGESHADEVSMLQDFLTPQQTNVFPTSGPFPTITPLPTATPLITPSPTPAAPGCDTAFPIEIGGFVTVRPGVTVRAEPSINGPIVETLPENREFIVLDGPVCGDNYQWWRIRGGGINGWVAERNRALDFIRFIFPPVDSTPGCEPPFNLEAGQVVDLNTGVRVREEPNLNGLVLTVAQINTPVTILSDEPTCGDGLNWRRVQVTVVGTRYEGWMVEGTAFAEYVALPTTDPGLICYPPINLESGDRRRVRYYDDQPKALRAGPGRDEELLFSLVNGVPFEILDGPVCANGQNYWRVRILASFEPVGWLAEGPRPNYWSRPFTSEDAYPPP
jgi:hypothetical protein